MQSTSDTAKQIITILDKPIEVTMNLLIDDVVSVFNCHMTLDMHGRLS